MNFNRVLSFFIFSIFIEYFLFFPISFAENSEQFTTLPEISAEAAILIDSSSDKVFYGKNENQQMFPASITKVLTAILVLENCKLNDIVTVPNEAISSIPYGYSIAALQLGEQLTVNQLLQLMMVHSANDAANVLAFHVSGSIDNFADLMNQKVNELGMMNTHFTNPSGMQDQNHYTTANDLSILMKYCMKNNTFRNLAGLKSCSIPATNKYGVRNFSTTNHLLINSEANIANNSYYEYAIAGKTGFTTEAKNCLTSVASKDGLELICVVLASGVNANGTSTKFSDSKILFEFGYQNYGIKNLLEQGYTVSTTAIPNATSETSSLDLVAASDISVLMKNSEMGNDMKPEIVLNSNLYAPISQGQVVGKVVYTIDGVQYDSDLIASHSVIPNASNITVLSILLLIFVLFVLFLLLFPKKKAIKKQE